MKPLLRFHQPRLPYPQPQSPPQPHLRLLFLVLLSPVLLLVLPIGANAQIYVCKDANGRTITADRPIPECANRSMRELDGNGLTRREIAAPATPEQKREQQAQQAKRRVEEAAAQEQRLYDHALTTRYRSESDIAVARQRAVDLLDDQMRIDTNALALEMTEMKAAQAVAANAGKTAGTPIERRRLQEAGRVVEMRLSSIERRTAEIERVNQKFDLAVKRFSEIRLAIDPGRSTGAAR